MITSWYFRQGEGKSLKTLQYKMHIDTVFAICVHTRKLLEKCQCLQSYKNFTCWHVWYMYECLDKHDQYIQVFYWHKYQQSFPADIFEYLISYKGKYQSTYIVFADNLFKFKINLNTLNVCRYLINLTRKQQNKQLMFA